jgi:hypothetical protein
MAPDFIKLAVVEILKLLVSFEPEDGLHLLDVGFLRVLVLLASGNLGD